MDMVTAGGLESPFTPGRLARVAEELRQLMDGRRLAA